LVSTAVRRFFAAHGGYRAGQVRWLREATVQVMSAAGSEPDPLAKTGLKRFLQIAVRSRTRTSGMIAPNGCCVPLLKKMHVGPNGDIHLCEKVDQDNPVGNVNNEGLRFDRVERIVREYCERSIEDCGRCWANRLCTACYRDFFRGGEWQPAGRMEFCEKMRVRLTEMLEDYAAVLERRPDAFEHLKGVTLDFPV
jgi:radical SAM protein with 4Fe4S-binding SPASM domain